MTTTNDIARQLVKDVGGDPGNKLIVRAVAVWLAFESGTRIVGNNPWNMRPGPDAAGTCQKGVDPKNFIVFCTWEDGVKATAQRLMKNDYRGYFPIAKAIQAGDPIKFFKALAASKWSADNYGGGDKLIAAFQSATDYNKLVTFTFRYGGPTGSTGGSGTGTQPGDDTPIEGVIPNVAGAIEGIGNTVVKLASYIIGVVIVVIGLWLYSKSGNKVELPE